MDRHHRQPERLIFNHALNEDWLQQHHAVRSYPMSPQLSSSSSYGSTSSSYMSTSPTTQYHSTDVRHPSYGHARQHNSGYGLDLCVSPIDLHNDRHGASNSIRVLPSSDGTLLREYEDFQIRGHSSGAGDDSRHGDRGPSNEKERCRCPEEGCPSTFSRKADVARHYKSTHNVELMDCPKNRCNRVGDNGFARRDHLLEHLRGYHGEPVPKRNIKGGGRSHH